jgi:uncharacterized protein YtpQ (UPF0354 family)
MGKALLSEAAFNRVVVNRARRERPDIRVQTMGKYLLLVEAEPGHRRVVSLVGLYQSYREAPQTCDEVVGAFLTNQVYEVQAPVQGTFAENQHRIMPQVVPLTLLEYCRNDNRELAAVHFVAGLGIAFVVDDDEGYTYIHRKVMQAWGVTDTTLLRVAMENLQTLTNSTEPYYRLGTGEHTLLLWETFDGYDASRVLLAGELTRAAATLGGNPVIAVPHRDYMVLFGDTDPEFVGRMQTRVREEFEGHPYPISPQLFALAGGQLLPYNDQMRRERVVN